MSRHHHHQPLCSNSDSQWVLEFLQKKIVYTACAHCRWACSSPHLSPCCLASGVFGDYEELLTAIQDGVVASCNVDEKRGLHKPPEWIAGFWFFGTPVTTTGACSSGSVLLSTYKLSVERCDCWRCASLVCRVSDRTEPEEDSPVYTPKADKFRVYRFPWRQGSP